MCLLKVYLDEGTGRKLVAEDVAVVVREGNKVELRSLELEEAATLKGVDISLIDMLNAVMIVKPKT